MRLRALPILVLSAALAATASCVMAPRLAPLDPDVHARWPGVPDIAFGLEGTGRSHGHVANLLVWNTGAASATVSIPEGSVLRATSGLPIYQRYGLWDAYAATLAPGERRWLELLGACLDPDLPPWPRWEREPDGSILSAREWASLGADGRPATLDARKLVAFLATTKAPFEEAKRSPGYVAPAVPMADDVVRQWAVNATVGAKTKRDLEATIARESPSMPVAERARTTEQVWGAVRHVVDVGGKAAAKSQGIDWARLDLTLKT